MEPATKMEKLNQDFLEFIQLLEKHHVKYIVVGGMRVASLKRTLKRRSEVEEKKAVASEIGHHGRSHGNE